MDGGTADSDNWYLTPEHIVDVVRRLSFLESKKSDLLEMWLCVRFWESNGAQGGDLTDDAVSLKIEHCRKFADEFFGVDLDPEHRWFMPFKFKEGDSSSLWRLARGGNQWPAQSFWQRFKEINETKPSGKLFLFEHGTGVVAIKTRRGTDGRDAFREYVLRDSRLNVLDLAEWYSRTRAWPAPPSDEVVVRRFIDAVRILPDEHDLFDEQSNRLLTAAEAMQ